MMADHLIKDLGNGLVLRSARLEDAEALAVFNGGIHGSENPFDRRGVAAWTRDLMTLPHPTFSPADFTVVEDTLQGKIVSSLNLISQTWSYGGIPFGVGRIELVGTDPKYRRRGLVREQFEVVHRWSQERGEMVQAITGIPFYYRQFGYELALNLDGGRLGYQADIPELAEGQVDPYRVRPAQEADLPFVAEVNRYGSRRAPLNAVRDESIWRYELGGRSPDNINRFEIRIIESSAGEAVGFLLHPPFLWRIGLAVNLYELKAGVSYWEVSPSVMRYLWATGQAYAAAGISAAARPRCEGIYYWLGEGHPLYDVYPHRMTNQRRPYAYYMRVPDLAAFLRRVAPVLEERLANSVCCGYTGALRLSFYTSGLNMVFSQGKLADAVNLGPMDLESAEIAFPGLTFLQLVFGYRSLADIRAAFADCWLNEDKGLGLLNALFPRIPSDFIPIS